MLIKRCYFKVALRRLDFKNFSKMESNTLNLHHPLWCSKFRSFGILPYSISERKETSKNYFLEFTDDEDIKAGSISATHFLWCWIICFSDFCMPLFWFF